MTAHIHTPLEAQAATAPLPLTRLKALRSRVSRRLVDDEGAATAEYAIVVTAGVALASVLVLVAQSDPVRKIIEDLLVSAFGG